MSFSHDVKTELCAAPIEGLNAKKAELYGLLLFGHMLTPSGILLQTEHEGVVAVAAALFEELYHITPARRASVRSDGGSLIALSVDSRADCLRILDSFGYAEKIVSLRINQANLETESDGAAFVRGAFLSCGTVVDPGKDYHLEFVTPYLNLSRDLAFILGELEFAPKNVSRKGNYIVYFKDSEQIEDMLTLMGAVHQSLELMNVKVYKDFRNKANRVTNCETANIGKTVNASLVQVEAIRKLQSTSGFDELPEELREIARLRIENPEVSLRELGKMLPTPLSRSGVNHRLGKLIALAGMADKLSGRRGTHRGGPGGRS